MMKDESFNEVSSDNCIKFDSENSNSKLVDKRSNKVCEIIK